MKDSIRCVRGNDSSEFWPGWEAWGEGVPQVCMKGRFSPLSSVFFCFAFRLRPWFHRNHLIIQRHTKRQNSWPVAFTQHYVEINLWCIWNLIRIMHNVSQSFMELYYWYWCIYVNMVLYSYSCSSWSLIALSTTSIIMDYDQLST